MLRTKCEIKYDNNPQAIFYAGDTISGTVEITLFKPKIVKGINLKLKGYAETKWTQGGAHNEKGRYGGREDYFKRLIFLAPEQTLQPGTYKYDFQHQLDPKFPSSFEHENGFIRYSAKVILVQPLRDRKFKFGMTVLNHLELNRHSELRNPVRLDAVKDFKGFFFARGAINFDVEVPMTGYVSGQEIPLKINVNNASDVEVNQISVKLKQEITLFAPKPRHMEREVKRDVFSGLLQPVGKSQSRYFASVVPIASVPPTSRKLCMLIKYNYVLVVKLRLNLHADESIRIPIMIGTKPFSDLTWIDREAYGALDSDATVMNLEPPTLEREDSLPLYDDILREKSEMFLIDPPTYEASLLQSSSSNSAKPGGSRDSELFFTPLYPVYHRSTQQNGGNSGSRVSHENIGWRVTLSDSNEADETSPSAPPPAYEL